MPHARPVKRLLDQCKTGFTVRQKVLLLACGSVYVICPFDFDFIPLVGWIDDGFVLHLMYRVLRSPTLPSPPGSGGSEAGTANSQPASSRPSGKAVLA